MEKFNLTTFIDNDNYLFVKDVHDGIIDIYDELFDIIRSEKEDNDLKLCELDHLYEYEGKLNKILVAGNPEYLKNNYDTIIEPFKLRNK